MLSYKLLGQKGGLGGVERERWRDDPKTVVEEGIVRKKVRE